MTDKETVKLIKKLLAEIDEGFNKPCKALDIECGNCKAELLRAMLNWYLDLISYKCPKSATVTVKWSRLRVVKDKAKVKPKK